VAGQTEDRDRFAQEVKAALEGRSLGVREVARRSNGGISSTSVLNMTGTASRWADKDAVIVIRFVNNKVMLKSFDKPPERK